MLKRVAVTVAISALMLGTWASAANAADGYRGTTVHGCTSYISGSNAWTNCFSTDAAGSVRTKAWCTAQPTRYGNWTYLSSGSSAYPVSNVGCTFNVYTAQAMWQ